MTTFYFVTLTVTYLVNAIYFATKFVAHSSAHKSRTSTTPSDMQTRCCS